MIVNNQIMAGTQGNAIERAYKQFFDEERKKNKKQFSKETKEEIENIKRIIDSQLKRR